MRSLKPKYVVSAILLPVLTGLLTVSAARAQNTINGIVFDSDRKPVAEINIDLLDEFERLLRTTKTRGSGVYLFQSLPAGNYYVQVRTGGTGFKETKERIRIGAANRTVQTSSGPRTSGAETRQLNFYLETDPRRRRELPPLGNAVIFAQNVPVEAERFYQKALKDLEKERSDEAVGNLQRALSVFPEYFVALEKLGNLYLDRREYPEAENIFHRAVAVYQKSFRSFFGLAVAQNKLGKKEAAAANLNRANEIDASSINANLLLGIILRELKRFGAAETALLRAKRLAANDVPAVHWQLGLLYYYNFRLYDRAADELELYLEATPKEEKRKMREKVREIKKLIDTLRQKAGESSG